jgi:peroxiredoxin
MKLFKTLIALSIFVCACSKDSSNDDKAQPAPAAKPPAAAPPAVAPPAQPAVPAAVVGQPAPDFKLQDLQGKEVSLSALRGKVVVIEWFNPQCPFVIASHTKGGLVATAKRHTDAGVVWLAINSAAPGKQGHEQAVNEEAVKTWGMTHPVLRDESGTVGRAYGASNTPHMFVVDAAGTLVYAGAIDNSPDGEGASPADGKLINYIDAALGDLAAGRPVAVPTSKAYGCKVKYAS